MTARVRIHPSNHEFLVQGSDTILEAALGAGLALNYGCSNGNCGLCKARIIAGEIKKVRHHDFVVTASDKAKGYVLLCAHTAVTDIVVEAPEAGRPYDIPLQHVAARVKGRERLTDDLTLLSLQTPRSNRLRFLAGQYVTLGAGGVNANHRIASCPCDDRNLEFHVASRQGNFADYVFNHMKIGETVTIEGPKGNFVLDDQSTRPLLFLAHGIGFAPIKSLIEHAMAQDAGRPLHLCWIASGSDGHYLDNLCRSWADAVSDFRYALIDEAAINFSAAIRELIPGHPGLAGHDIYVAGPREQTMASVAVLRDHGAAESQLYVDSVE